MIKVSVIVPVYKVEKFIGKCLDSLINQSLKDIEIIVVNDGSPDNSQKIIDKYVKKFPKIFKSYIKENGGQGSARNLGLDVAKGEYISFIDSDDFIDKDMLLKMYNFSKKENADIVVCNMLEICSNGKKIQHNCIKYNNEFNMAGSSCNKIFKKSFIKNIRFSSGIWYEDLEFTAKVLSLRPKISCINENLYFYNSGHLSTMNNENSLKNLDMLVVLDNIKKFLIQNNNYSDDLFTYLCYKHILVSTMPRVYNQSCLDKKSVLKKLKEYYNSNVSMKFWKSKYFVNEDKGDILVALLFNYKLYFIYGIIHKLKH